jgi:hypothetical protein
MALLGLRLGGRCQYGRQNKGGGRQGYGEGCGDALQGFHDRKLHKKGSDELAALS